MEIAQEGSKPCSRTRERYPAQTEAAHVHVVIDIAHGHCREIIGAAAAEAQVAQSCYFFGV